ncbi:MAG TPA: TIGR03088 family PEP-CTERM/XrtA system glycosyltransferase, partial [Candidatus Tenderia electrophaga]|nr:TIGR03088 family PEP-CTERM/XrtA system glycosyltransferase [Candidatus Tenderia electrophaga]
MAHVLHRFDVGGLENGVVNLINRIPADQYRHAIIAMTECTAFAKRLNNPNVTLHTIHKREGKDLGSYLRLWRLLRQLRPEIVHSRNLSAIEAAVVAALAGVPYRVHGEHGRDVHDIDGTNKKYLQLRRFCQPFIQRYIPLSQDLEQWLKQTVGVPANKVVQLYNGVDSQRFSPVADNDPALANESFFTADSIVIGTAGRMMTVKDQPNLVRAFIELLDLLPQQRDQLRLVLIGDGPLSQVCEQMIAAAGIENQCWLTGSRDDVPQLMRRLDLFVLPSLAEGISNTILEAMATGLAVVATRVGGNPELVLEGKTGALVAAAEPTAMAKALAEYVTMPDLMQAHGAAGRARVETDFSMEKMVQSYMAVYDS